MNKLSVDEQNDRNTMRVNVQKYAVKQSGNDGTDRKYEGEKAEVTADPFHSPTIKPQHHHSVFFISY